MDTDSAPLVAEFSAITSMAPAREAHGLLLLNKIAELSDEHRGRFRRKLAALFGRPDDLDPTTAS